MLIVYVDNAVSAPLPDWSWSGALASRDLVRRFLAVGYVRRFGGRQETAWLASSSRGDLIITKEACFSELQLNKTTVEILDLLRDLLGFSDQELGRALGVTARSVKRWRAGGQISTESEQHLFDLMRTVAALAKLELPPANIRAWFFYSNPFLNEERPIDVFTTGKYAALRPAIDAIADAAFG